MTAETVTRQADRFVVSIGNTPALAGQDGTELLARAPGVWLGDNGISINGAGGTKVYVDGRELIVANSGKDMGLVEVALRQNRTG